MNANSARFLKTDDAIREAFWTLLREKGFFQLRATDIIKTAGVNRSTFYEHYLDKYDLAERLEDELLNEFAMITEGAFPSLLEGGAAGGDGGAEFCRRMVSWLSVNGEKFVLLMKSDGSPSFNKKLKQRVQTFWNSRHITTYDPMRDRYVRAAVLGFVTGLLNEWVDAGMEHSPEQFNEIFMEALVPLYDYMKRHSVHMIRTPENERHIGNTTEPSETVRSHTNGSDCGWEHTFLETANANLSRKEECL